MTILIVGGGMVGASMAVGIAHRYPWLTKHLTVLQPDIPLDDTQATVFDARALALSAGSIDILQDFGLWPHLATQAEPIRRIHVSEQDGLGDWGSTELNAKLMGYDVFGQTILASDLGRVCYEQLQAHQIPIINGKLATIDQTQNGTTVTLDNGDSLHCEWLLGCDGSDSTVRQALGIGKQVEDYGQHAILARSRWQLPFKGRAYERFTPNGPMALLPLNDYEAKLVVVVNSAEKEAWLSLGDDAFAQRLYDKFGYKQGWCLQLSDRQAYPLKAMKADALVQGRCALLGNAAHTQHPIAGQGYNLGLRDAHWLWHRLIQRLDGGDDNGDLINWADLDWFSGYQSERESDIAKTMGFTSRLIHWFEHDSPLVSHLRRMGLMAFNGVPALQRRVANMAMGRQ